MSESGPTQPEANSSEAVSLLDAVRFLQTGWKRHWQSAMFVGLGVLGLTAAYIFLAPKKYRSEAQLYVRLGRESVTLDPTATTGETFNVSSSRENEINSVVEILASPGNYDAVVQRFTPEVVLETAPIEFQFDADDEGIQDNNESTARNEPPHTEFVSFSPSQPPGLAFETAATALKKQISIEGVRRSNVVNASCVAGSPALAQQMLSAYLDVAIERHMRASRPSRSFEFFQEQAEDVDSQYSKLAGNLAELKSEVGVVSLEERRKTLQEQLSKIESDLSTTEAELSEAQGMVEGLTKLMETMPKTSVATTTGQPQDALGEAERQRNVLAIREQELLAKYTENHPKVASLREQIQRANTMLERNEGRSQSLEGINPAYIQVETQLATERAKVTGLEQKRNAYEKEREKARERLAQLNSRDAQIASLEERVKVLRTTAADYTTKLEQARIDRALEYERLSNITVSQPPTFVSKAVSPKRRSAAVIGFVLAAGLAVLTIVIREFLDRDSGLEPIRLPETVIDV